MQFVLIAGKRGQKFSGQVWSCFGASEGFLGELAEVLTQQNQVKKPFAGIVDDVQMELAAAQLAVQEGG